MCQPSKMDPDWVPKGFHLKLDGIEIAIRPAHTPTYRDGFVVRKVFSSTSDEEFAIAERKAREVCLTDSAVRDRWRRDLERGIVYVRSFAGTGLAAKANGRQCEFRWLIRHLNAYGVRHGYA